MRIENREDLRVAYNLIRAEGNEEFKRSLKKDIRFYTRFENSGKVYKTIKSGVDGKLLKITFPRIISSEEKAEKYFKDIWYLKYDSERPYSYMYTWKYKITKQGNNWVVYHLMKRYFPL